MNFSNIFFLFLLVNLSVNGKTTFSGQRNANGGNRAALTFTSSDFNFSLNTSTVPGLNCGAFKILKPVIMRDHNNLAVNIKGDDISYQWFRNDTVQPGQSSYRHTNRLQNAYYKVRLSMLDCNEPIISDERYVITITEVVTITSVEQKTVNNCLTAIDGDLELANISIFPNPGSGTFYLESENITPGNISVFNSQGTQIYEQAYTDQIPLNSAPSGIYLMKIFDKVGILIKKLRVVVE